MNVPQNYLDLTSELLQEILNIYTDENRIFTCCFRREDLKTKEINKESTMSSLPTTISYQVSISKPTREQPIPSLVYDIRVGFKLPSNKILKNLSSLPFIQHVLFFVEHRKEPFEIHLHIEDGVLTDSSDTIKKEFDLMALIDQFLGKELTISSKEH
ncbi:hypothetical protein C9374_014148 [Naegleria lovaniensis]|uniref:Uncharacterized protein n=1 Tax=Naegleria lovaniensis TaxID=51637 RepID=A0AA88KPM4_NAELO|nr:uncharacterized protein C9374_014148 [Naegleria lovaniensis]KAG2389588.1 hypothetical protein C9374_014148 [Naegleria lovaniensis]